LQNKAFSVYVFLTSHIGGGGVEAGGGEGESYPYYIIFPGSTQNNTRNIMTVLPTSA